MVRDRTGSLRSQDEILDQNEYLNAILQTTADGFYVLDSHGTFLMANGTYCRMVGFDAKELVGKPINDLDSIETPEETQQRMRRVVAAGYERFETRQKRKDGTRFDAEITTSFLDRNGGVFICFCRDITERLSKDQRLVRSQAYLDALLENKTASTWAVDTEYRLIMMNDQFRGDCRLSFGRELEIGERVLQSTFPPDMFAEWQGFYDRALRGEHYRFERRRSLTPSELWNDYIFNPITVDTGEVVGVLVLAFEISERKMLEAQQREMETQLRSSESLFRSMFDQSAVGMVVVGLDGRFQKCNAAFNEFIGYADGELVGRKVAEITHPEDAHLGMQEMRYLVEGKIVSARFEKRYIHRDGSTIWGEINICLIRDLNHSPLFFMPTIVDITQRKKAESRVAALLSERELMLKEVHHRVKNNMNMICSLLNLQSAASADKDVSAALADADARVRSMMTLYDKLYQSGDYSGISVKDYLETLVDDIIRNSADDGRIKITYMIDDFTMHPKWMQLVGIIINELVTNSIKYAFTGRSSGAIAIKAIRSKENIVVSVADDGIGISAGISFENTTGFGLQLIKALADQLHGTLDLRRGPGTEVSISIDPKYSEQAALQAAAQFRQ